MNGRLLWLTKAASSHGDTDSSFCLDQKPSQLCTIAQAGSNKDSQDFCSTLSLLLCNSCRSQILTCKAERDKAIFVD